MLAFFKRKKETEKFLPQASGRLETTFAHLKEKFGNNLAGRIYDIDIGEFAQEFEGFARLPQKIQEAVRSVLDDYLREGHEFYFQVDERIFGLYFGNANKTVAELKVQVVRNELARVIEDIKKKKQPAQKVLRKEAGNEPESERRGTLSKNPDEKEMRDWASRALLNMATRNGYENFEADVRRLSEIIKVRYAPLWYVSNRLVSGYVIETTASLPSEDYSEKQSHEDLAILGAAARQLKEMAGRNEHALIVVPVHVRTICGKNTRELYNIYCRNMEPNCKRFIVLRLKGLEKSLSPAEWESLKSLAFHCRSMIVDTGHRKLDPKKLGANVNFHSFGFNLSGLGLPEDKLFQVLDDFAEFYEKEKKDVFILGISTPSLLGATLGAGYTYVSGPAVAPFLDRPRHASFLELEDLYKAVL